MQRFRWKIAVHFEIIYVFLQTCILPTVMPVQRLLLSPDAWFFALQWKLAHCMISCTVCKAVQCEARQCGIIQCARQGKAYTIKLGFVHWPIVLPAPKVQLQLHQGHRPLSPLRRTAMHCAMVCAMCCVQFAVCNVLCAMVCAMCNGHCPFSFSLLLRWVSV